MRRDKPKKLRLRWLLLAAVLLAVGWALYGAFYTGPTPQLQLTTSRPAIGSQAAAGIQASFSEPERGLGEIRLEIEQGGQVLELAREDHEFPSPWKPFDEGQVEQKTLVAQLGAGIPEWLEEGEVVIRATAERLSGPLRSAPPIVEEMRLPVRLRPPTLMVTSNAHYVRQGGAGAVVFDVGETAVRSGVVAGDVEFRSFDMPGGSDRSRFAIFGIPWDQFDHNAIRVFVEDDAGNRAETAFVDVFSKSPPRRDTIRIPDSFLERVVPQIAARVTRFDTSGSLLDQYLRINRDLRQANRAKIKELSDATKSAFLWSGAFLPLPNAARKAGYGEVRSYRYNGAEVDEQTHLGLDLASTARAPVPAPNGGTVVWADYLGIYGNAVIVDHGYGVVSVCAHLSSIAVEPGQTVEKGQSIGRTGATGLAGGDHLHLGIFVQGVAVDPIQWLDAKWIADNLATKLPLP